MGYTDEVGVQLPPLHPRCRCAIIYRETGESATKPNVRSLINEFKPASNALITPPKEVSICKTFDELKIFWAENYNVKVSETVGNLHFDSVRTACAGIEGVIKEFLPAGQRLDEIGTKRSGVMCAEYGGAVNKINFNPAYFDIPEHLSGMIMGTETGFHPKNTGILEAGSHEMGHILEDWLNHKHDGTFQDLKKHLQARQLIQRAFAEAKKKQKGKTITQMKEEISEYATTNIAECLAESVADYIANGEQAALLSRQIWRELKKELN